jgi:3-dehydroquinate synthase
MEGLDIEIAGADGRRSRIAFGSLAGLGGEIDPAKTVIVTDAEILRLHGGKLPSCPVALVPPGEAAKSLGSLEELYGRFLELELGRDGSVLAVGGGTVSDLSGFAASTWLRGIDFGFAPTTLLAMVDASVGGKNGVDFRGVKNLIGSFSQPRFVRIDVSLLDTLSDSEFASGMGEVVKHAVIAGGEYFELVESSAPAQGRSRSGAGARPERELLERIVSGSVRLKAEVVSADEREGGRRRVLNLGHSAGHGIELATGIPHGHAVAAGLGTACRFALRSGALGRGDCDRITRLAEAWGLPSSIAQAAALGRVADAPELRAAIAAALASDKKRLGFDLMMALPKGLGTVVVEAVKLADFQAFVKEAP